MKPKKFNPFTDRESRDIRNDLSEKLVEAMAIQSPAPFEAIAEKLLKRFPDNPHAGYITNRCARYRKIITIIRDKNILSPLEQALLPWNENLFFECHELLESHWKSASGDMKEACKGLIKAAGAYIHLEQERYGPAAKLGKKAAAILSRYKSRLSFISDPDSLIRSLYPLNSDPPRILFKQTKRE